MAGLGGRKGPNVSHYLANLNAIPSEHDLATQQSENFDFSSDLAAFTNTEFLEFDQGENVFQSPIDYDPLNDGLTQTGPAVPQEDGKHDFGRLHPPRYALICHGRKSVRQESKADQGSRSHWPPRRREKPVASSIFMNTSLTCVHG